MECLDRGRPHIFHLLGSARLLRYIFRWWRVPIEPSWRTLHFVYTPGILGCFYTPGCTALFPGCRVAADQCRKGQTVTLRRCDAKSQQGKDLNSNKPHFVQKGVNDISGEGGVTKTK